MGRTANRHVAWLVPYVAGTISAKGYVGNKVIAQDTRETTGPAVKLALSMEWPTSGGLKANNVDVALVTVSLLDAKGRLVPTTSSMISFSLSGPGKIIGLGNGDPSCHEHDKPNSPTKGMRSAWNGLARVILQSTHEKGTLQLSVQADSLTGVSMNVMAV